MPTRACEGREAITVIRMREKQVRSADAVQGEGTLEENEERLCVICLVNERDTTVLPCRHLCMCHDCAQVPAHAMSCD